MMRVKYRGISFGVEGLTDGKEYEVIAIEDGMLRVIDDSGEDYLYSAIRPSSLEDENKYGAWEIISDNREKELEKLIDTLKDMLLYGLSLKQAEDMYEQLKKIKSDSCLTVEEVARLVKEKN